MLLGCLRVESVACSRAHFLLFGDRFARMQHCCRLRRGSSHGLLSRCAAAMYVLFSRSVRVWQPVFMHLFLGGQKIHFYALFLTTLPIELANHIKKCLAILNPLWIFAPTHRRAPHDTHGGGGAAPTTRKSKHGVCFCIPAGRPQISNNFNIGESNDNRIINTLHTTRRVADAWSWRGGSEKCICSRHRFASGQTVRVFALMVAADSSRCVIDSLPCPGSAAVRRLRGPGAAGTDSRAATLRRRSNALL